MCTSGGDTSSSDNDSSAATPTPKPKPKAKPKAAPNFGAPKSSQRPMPKAKPKPTPKPRPKSAPSGSGASRKAAPTGEEYRAKRAPGQGDVKLPGFRAGRPKEPGGVDDRPAPKKTAPQAAFDSIQELRGRLDKQPPGALGAMGTISLKNQIKKLQEGAIPVMADGLTVGAITKEGSYTGRPEFGDFARANYRKGGATLDTTLKAQMDRQRAQQERDPEPPKPTAQPEEEIAEVAQMGSSGTTTKKRRRGSGRRTAFGTRQSLVNLRNV